MIERSAYHAATPRHGRAPWP